MKKKIRGLSRVLLALILVFTMLAHPFGASAMETAKNGGTPENAAQREAGLQEDQDLTAPSDGEAEDETADPEPTPEETEATEDSSQEEPDLNVSSDNRQGENYAAAVEQDGNVTYFDSFSTAADGANWVAGSTLRLMADATVSSTVTVPSGKHTLDLNGHALKAGSTGYSVVTVSSGAELVIDDTSENTGKITGGSVGQNYGGGVTVDGGTLTLKGGAISGNANTYGGIGNCGGGVHVRNSGKFYMEGGEISGNTSYVGGGVCTDSSAATVSITGGMIKNNQTERFGSAVWAGRSSSAVFRIGGTAQIVDNISKWTSDKDGEGTLNTGSTYLLSGDPTVHGDWKTNGQSSPNTHINLDNDGSGIQCITLEGALTNNTGTPKLTVTPLYRWSELQNGQTFTFTKNWSSYMGTAHPADYFKVDGSVSGVRVIRKGGEAAFTGGSDLGDLYIFFDGNGGEGAMDPQLATGVPLNPNAFTREGFAFAGWNTKADGSGTPYADEGIVNPSGDVKLYAQWKEYDASVIIGDTTTSYAAFSDALNAWTVGSTLKLLTDVTTSSTINAVGGAKTLDLNGYTITRTGGTGNNDGIAIMVKDAGNLTVTGPGKVTGGYGWHSGGIHVANNCSLVLDNCEISGNAGHYGGGLYCGGGTVTLRNGTIIQGNTASDGFGGSGIYAEGGGTLIMEDATFTGNEIRDNGKYAVFLCGNAKLQVSGAPVIYDNTYNGTQKNLYLYQSADQDSKVQIVGSLTEGTHIGVAQVNVTGVFTSGWTAYMGSADPSKYFTSDNSSYSVFLNNNGEAEIGTPPVASIIIGETATDYSAFPDAVNAWTAGSTLKLLTDVTTSSTVNVPSGEHTLDLNGHGILMTGSDRVITINQNASLELNDSDPDRIHYITLTDYRGTAVSDSGEASVSGGSGVIQVTGGYLTGGYRNNSGSHDKCGAGVFNWGTFVMNGGSIVGNTLLNNSGAGIRNSGYFTMNGGTIAFNKATGNGGGVTTYVPGGGQGKMTMNGGVISDNCCGSYGGGIQLAGPFEMTGGTVTRNTAGAGGSGVYYGGQGDRFKLSGNPVIKDNTNDDLYLNTDATFLISASLTEDAEIGITMGQNAVFTVGWKDVMGDADPSEYFASNDSNYAVVVNNSGELEIGVPPVASITNGEVTTTYGIFADALSAWAAGSTLKLLSDVTTDSTVAVLAGEHTLDLNGYGVKMTGSASVFTVGSGAKLIINDSNPETEHRFSLSNAQTNGAGFATVNDGLTSGYQTFTGGYITGGKGNTRSSWREGGAIYIEGEVEMNAGTLIGNGAYGSSHGGGFLTRESGRFVMNGGSIQNNAGLCGGACRLVGGSAEFAGGRIINNVVSNDGGGIHVGGSIPLVLKDCEISGNYANGGPGAGIWMSNDGTTVSGKPVIQDNFVGAREDNIEIPSGRVLYVGELAEGASIGITMQSGPAVFTSGWTGKMGDADPADYFISDNGDYVAALDESGEACLRYPDVPDVAAEGFSGDYDGKAHSITVTVPNGATVKYGTTEGDYSLTECPAYTDAGTYTVYYQATQDKHLPVAGSATVQIDPINATVTVTGNTASADYDGEVHSVSGYEAVASTPLYDVTKDFTFSGSATAEQTDAGTTEMGLSAGQFENTNSNFANVTFNVTDGYVTVNPITVTVTITGHNDTVDYDGKSHSVEGYDAVASSELYDVTKDFTFSGRAKATRTNAGKTDMGLNASQFKNTNANFATVTFNVTDGYIMIGPIDAIVTITGHTGTFDYDGELHTVEGYDVSCDNPLYLESDFSFSGTAKAETTNAGTVTMGLAAKQFKNTNDNFATVVFFVTDGSVTVEPIDATVTVTGHNGTVDYDGKAHSVEGYDAVASSDLYNVTKDFTFSGSAKAERTEAGTTEMGLSAGQFENTNSNFANVTFNVTDGYMTVNPITVTVTITGHSDTVDYNGKAQSVEGYDAVASSELYDVTKDFTFSGAGKAERTDTGTTEMGLVEEQFRNLNSSFIAVFSVTDGYLTVKPVNAVITAAPQAKSDLIYNGAEQELIVAGSAKGGTLVYAIGENADTSPANAQYRTELPVGKDTGNYYIWYRVRGDANHNSLAPVCLKVTLADHDWVRVSGDLTDENGDPVSNATVSLLLGGTVVDEVVSGSDGAYSFTVPEGTYNIVVVSEDATVTELVDVAGSTSYPVTVPNSDTDSLLDVVNTDSNIVVGGLSEEAALIRELDSVPDSQNVTVKMTVTTVTESETAGSKAISGYDSYMNFLFYDLRVEKTVDSLTTELDSTQNVLEVVIPCSFTDKSEFAVYRSGSSGVQALTESDSKAAGTYRVDRERGVVYIYTNSITTYAVGYKPYYSVTSNVSLGSYTGDVSVTLTRDGTGETYVLNHVSLQDISFSGIPKGTYSMTVTWIDGAENTITTPFTINEKIGGPNNE